MDMTPKEKAELIFRSMVVDMSIDAEQSLMCAINAVDEVLEALDENAWQNLKVIEYYMEVRKELEKL